MQNFKNIQNIRLPGMVFPTFEWYLIQGKNYAKPLGRKTIQSGKQSRKETDTTTHLWTEFSQLESIKVTTVQLIVTQFYTS